VLYITSLTQDAPENNQTRLESALESFLSAVDGSPECLYKLYYEYIPATGELRREQDGMILDFPTPPLTLAFADSTLDSVHTAWQSVMGSDAESLGGDEYMKFVDREGAEDLNDDYE
jgi:hypothetical protein